MGKFDQSFLEEMKKKLDLELLGVASLETSGSDELRRRTIALLPTAKSVAVLGKEMYKEIVALLGPSKGAGEAEAGGLIEPHGDYLNGRLTRAAYDLADLFRRDGYRSLPLSVGCPVDQRTVVALFSYKHAAQIAGLGTIGRHGLLITRKYGPRVRLASVLTEAPLEPSPGVYSDYCTGCDACIRECPAQALQVPKPGETYAINKFACRTYRNAGLTCSVCLKVCDEVLTGK